MSEPKITWKRPRTFKTESGEVLPLCPVNEFDLTHYIKQLTEGGPKPPVEIIDGVPVANEGHEDYREALQIHNLKRGTLTLALYVEFGLDMDLTDEQQASVERSRRKMERLNPGGIENRFDLFIYAKSICTTEELSQLLQTIQALNTPSSEQVQDHLNTFRSDVPRSATNANQDAPKWNRVPDWQPETFPVQGGDLGGDGNTALLRRVGPNVAG